MIVVITEKKRMMLQLRVKRNMELKVGSGVFAGFSTGALTSPRQLTTRKSAAGSRCGTQRDISAQRGAGATAMSVADVVW